MFTLLVSLPMSLKLQINFHNFPLLDLKIIKALLYNAESDQNRELKDTKSWGFVHLILNKITTEAGFNSKFYRYFPIQIRIIAVIPGYA